MTSPWRSGICFWAPPFVLVLDAARVIEGPALALAFDTRLSAAEIETDLNRLLEIRLRLPEYLFTKF